MRYNHKFCDSVDIYRQNCCKFADETVGKSQDTGIGIRDFFLNPNYVCIREIAYQTVMGATITLDTVIDDDDDGVVQVRDCMVRTSRFDQMMGLMNDAYTKFVRIVSVETWDEYYEIGDEFVVNHIAKTTFSDGSVREDSTTTTYIMANDAFRSAMMSFMDNVGGVWYSQHGDDTVVGSTIRTTRMFVIKTVSGKYMFMGGDAELTIHG